MVMPAADATRRSSLFWPMMMPTSAARRGETSEAESPIYTVKPVAPTSTALLSRRSSKTLDLSAPLWILLQHPARGCFFGNGCPMQICQSCLGPDALLTTSTAHDCLKCLLYPGYCRARRGACQSALPKHSLKDKRMKGGDCVKFLSYAVLLQVQSERALSGMVIR